MESIGLAGFRRGRQRLPLNGGALLAGVAATRASDFVLAGIGSDLARPEVFGHVLNPSTL